jgi:hypothetical protein
MHRHRPHIEGPLIIFIIIHIIIIVTLNLMIIVPIIIHHVMSLTLNIHAIHVWARVLRGPWGVPQQQVIL